MTCHPHSIPHDRHARALIDRQVAIDMLMASGRSFEAAEADLQGISSTPAIEITVEPGEWHLYFHADYETMPLALAEADIASPKDSHFVISRTPLALNPERLVDLSEEFSIENDPPSPKGP